LGPPLLTIPAESAPFPSCLAPRWYEGRRQRPVSKRGIGLDFHLTSLLDPKWQDQPLSPEKRAVVEALLKRDENGSEDNPPLTLLFSSLKTAAPRTSSAAV